MNPVSKIVSDVVQKLTASRQGSKIDLREFQSALLQVQRRNRLARPSRAEARARRHRLRVRQLPVAECKVIDTRTDQARSRMYFELSNGQVVRAGRPFKNALLQDLVSKEVAANAARRG